jgi:integrase
MRGSGAPPVGGQGAGLHEYVIEAESDDGGEMIRQSGQELLCNAPGRTIFPSAASLFLERAAHLGADKPEHYLFPACESNHVDPSRPTKGWRTAWRSLTRAAGLRGLRFHDLRHHAITELAEMGLSDQTVMSIAGHVSREMLDHYSHIRLVAKRKALEALETPLPEPEAIPKETVPAIVN